MKRIIIALTSLLLVSGFVCKGQSCADLPATFKTYPEAIMAVERAEFEYKDQLPAGKSKWIITANYYSCDGYTGYLIFTSDKGNEFIHADVPKNIWTAFKEAKSIDFYYDTVIKDQFKLMLTYKRN